MAVFFVKFILLFCLFYGFNYAFTGIVSPPNYYNPWIDQHFNYLRFFRNFLLHTSSLFVGLFGYHAVITGHHMRVDGGGGIRLAYACMGLGILCFWWAFVLAFPQKIAYKVKYLCIGTLAIILLNVMRISLLSIYLSHATLAYKYHHFLFNVATYAVIFFLIFKWIDKSTAFEKSNSTEPLKSA